MHIETDECWARIARPPDRRFDVVHSGSTSPERREEVASCRHCGEPLIWLETMGSWIHTCTGSSHYTTRGLRKKRIAVPRAARATFALPLWGGCLMMISQLAAFLVGQPSAVAKLLAQHVDDGRGHCQACGIGGQRGHHTWPCTIFNAATTAAGNRSEGSVVLPTEHDSTSTTKGGERI
jgi:hypothetical protein